MTTQYEERPSDSPYAYTVAQIVELSDGVNLFPADAHWHLFITHREGKMTMSIGGPITKAVSLPHSGGEDALGIRFRMGMFMPIFPASMRRDSAIALPEASSKSFWLNGSAWEYPTLENADTFINRLVREGVLVREPVVQAALNGELKDDLSLRSVQRRFLRATGMTHTYVYQLERAKRAAALLQQGVSILDTVDEAGFSDQPHLTRALKHFIGQTPVQLLREPLPAYAQA